MFCRRGRSCLGTGRLCEFRDSSRAHLSSLLPFPPPYLPAFQSELDLTLSSFSTSSSRPGILVLINDSKSSPFLLRLEVSEVELSNSAHETSELTFPFLPFFSLLSLIFVPFSRLGARAGTGLCARGWRRDRVHQYSSRRLEFGDSDGTFRGNRGSRRARNDKGGCASPPMKRSG